MMLSCKQLLRISTTLGVRIFSFHNKIKNNCNASRSELLDRWTLRSKEKLSKMSKGYQQSLNILGQDKKKRTNLGFKLFYCLFLRAAEYLVYEEIADYLGNQGR